MKRLQRQRAAGFSLRLLILAVLGVVGCGLGGPSRTDITCQKGYGNCYVVHCDKRSLSDCQSYFKGFCPKGFADSHYGNDDPRTGNYDRLVECK